MVTQFRLDWVGVIKMKIYLKFEIEDFKKLKQNQNQNLS